MARLANPQLWNGYSYVANNPLGYLDPDGLERIQLGESSEQIEEEIKRNKAKRKAIEMTRSDDRKSLLDANKAQLKTLETKLQGTRVVEQVLERMDAEGIRGNLQLSDFELSTNLQQDFGGIYNKDQLAKLANSQAFVRGGDSEKDKSLIGDRIIIRSDNQNPAGFYNMMRSGDFVTRWDGSFIGAGVIGHEQYHREHRDAGEAPAYRKEAEFLNRVQHKFRNGLNWERRMNYVRSQY